MSQTLLLMAQGILRPAKHDATPRLPMKSAGAGTATGDADFVQGSLCVVSMQDRQEGRMAREETGACSLSKARSPKGKSLNKRQKHVVSLHHANRAQELGSSQAAIAWGGVYVRQELLN